MTCFERVIEADPGCALGYWGLAYALGPNYNKPWEAFGQAELASSVSRAFTAAQAAVRRWAAEPPPAAPPVERALVRALAARYPSAAPAADCSPWNTGYADAMREVYRSYPDDLDVAALLADALMNLTPWALWDQATGQPADGAATDRGPGGTGAGPGLSRRPGPPRDPAHVHPPDGDVAHPGSRPPGR